MELITFYSQVKELEKEKRNNPNICFLSGKAYGLLIRVH